MGNDVSQLKGLQIDKEPVESNDFWSFYNSDLPREGDGGSTPLTIFRGEPIVAGQLWITQTPLERAIKNLMIYRHPHILKYVTSWEQSGSKKHLATERVRPLSMILAGQNDVQKCLGLRNILASLIFLIEQAKARHLNIAISSIYVNGDDEWRLGGFEHVWKTKDFSKNILDLANSYRYKAAIDPNEAKTVGEGLEQYAFGVLCEEILKGSKASDIPFIAEFRDYCATHLKHQNVAMRPRLSAVLLHPYFNHEFILIHSFLTELPLKNQQEKQDFFTGLIDRLRYFDESIVACQIGNLLLSRMVLLDPTAQLCVTPYVFKTKTDIFPGLFSHQTFVNFILPRIKQIFYVRDAQIRIILLEYFNEYVQLLPMDDLKENILPNLLLGIKDTNDFLVAKTLRCLADIVPILGSQVVIGGNRGHLFADGRPHAIPDVTSHWSEPRSITPVMSPGQFMTSVSPLPDNVDISGSYISISSINNSNMPPRLSPDGGEDRNDALTIAEIEDDAWSDWENEEGRPNTLVIDTTLNVSSENLALEKPFISDNSGQQKLIDIDTIPPPIIPSVIPPSIKPIDDINELDIKIRKSSTGAGDEIDFFKDMVPVIQSSSKIFISEDEGEKNFQKPKVHEDPSVDKSRFEFKLEEDSPEDGWGDGWDEE